MVKKTIEEPVQEETVSSVSRPYTYRCEMLYERGKMEKQIRDEYSKVRQLESQMKEVEECSFKPRIKAMVTTPKAAEAVKKSEKYSKDERPTVQYADVRGCLFNLKANYMVSSVLIDAAERIESKVKSMT